MEYLENKLGIPRLYWRNTTCDDIFVVACSKDWLNSTVENCTPPSSSFTLHDKLTPDEIQACLWDPAAQLGDGWNLFYVNVIPKVQGTTSFLPVCSEAKLGSQDLTFSQFLHYVSQTNYKNMWKEAQKRYPNSVKHRHSKSRSSTKTSTTDALNFNLNQLYQKQEPAANNTTGLIDHVLPGVAIIESVNFHYVFLEYYPYSMHKCLTLSSAILGQNFSKSLFVLYELLRAIIHIQDCGLSFEGTSWHQIFLEGDTLWINVCHKVLSPLTSESKTTKNLQALTCAWERGALSNFDYLMAVNEFAGRKMNDPFNHPVLPWVSDLSSPFGNWRDLTRSKFRLNKGDRQLDMTFDGVLGDSSEPKDDVQTFQVPHHVTDVLSEITYYVYKARRTSRSILCRYVRPNWSPLEYPSSVERLQQWTPDECIPEFFTDPSIFKSIHEDLPDLELPSWASSAEDFIHKHRQALESPYVSERLHHWIDLTFGYRLSGLAAVKSKNVHLSLVDQHTYLTGRGIVQVFTQPHPRRLLPSPYSSRSPPRLPPPGKRAAEIQSIPMPIDYNPAVYVNQVECLGHFKVQEAVKPILPSSSHQASLQRQRDMQWLATLALELFLPVKFRMLPWNATLEDRLQVSQAITKHEFHEIPCCLRAFVTTVFQNDYITAQGLPPPSAYQLLQPMVTLLPFPADFDAIYGMTNQLRALRNRAEASFIQTSQKLQNILATAQPCSASLLVPYVKSLMECGSTAIPATFYLFDPVAAALGQQETIKEFVNILVKIFSPDFPVPDLMLLYHWRFLRLLQYRLGMKCFLNNFAVLLVEAVGGCYDFDPNTNQSITLISSTAANSSSEGFSGLETEVFPFETTEDEENNSLSSRSRYSSSTRISASCEKDSFREIHQLDGFNVGDVGAESVGRLSQRLGPVLCARYLTRNLLRMLALCYTDEGSLTIISSDQIKEFNMFQMAGTFVQGDRNALRVLTNLCSIAELYGEQFILSHYIPYAVETVGRCNGNLTMLMEGGLLGSSALILLILPFLQDSSLVQCLQESLLDQLLVPMFKLVISKQQQSPRGAAYRRILAGRLLDCACAVAVRLGMDVAVDYVSELAVLLLTGFETAAASSMAQTKPVGSAGSKPEYMTHQRKLSNTLKNDDLANNVTSGQATAADKKNIEAYAAAEIAGSFTDEFAYQVLMSLNLTLGIGQVEQLVEKHGRSAQRAAARWAAQLPKRDAAIFSPRFKSGSQSDDSVVTGSFGSRVSVVGNRIQLYDDEVDCVSQNQTGRLVIDKAQDLLCYKKTDSSRYLRGNWLAYWEHELGRHDRDVKFNFKQMKLQQLVGHTAGVRSIQVLDSEFGVLTAGRDKTAKVWNLSSQGDGSSSLAARFTYAQHRKPLNGLGFIDATRLAVTCDGSLHLWDPFTGSIVRQLDSSSKMPTVTALKCLPTPSAAVIVATAEGTLRLLDSRTPPAYEHELKISSASGGLVRCLAVSANGNTIAAGHSSGTLSLIDLRTGMLLNCWKGHEGEVLQVAIQGSGSSGSLLVSSSLDQSVSIWSAEDGKSKWNLRGPTEPVHCFSLLGSELISGTTANRIGVHANLSATASFSSMKLRSDTFKGVLTALAAVHLNRTLLLGSDTGIVSLFC